MGDQAAPGGGGGEQPVSRCIFVGNIPYDATEENLIEIFQEVGPVVSFRLVFDRETGKPKGFGFCEYHDAETALSAMRNLSNYEISGRNLRLDFAEVDKVAGGAGGGGGGFQAPEGLQDGMSGAVSGPGVAGRGAGGEITFAPMLDPAATPDAIAATIKSMSHADLYDFLKQLKQMTLVNMEESRALLSKNPQLAFACLQAQLQLQLVEPHVVTSMLKGGTASAMLHPPVTDPVGGAAGGGLSGDPSSGMGGRGPRRGVVDSPVSMMPPGNMGGGRDRGDMRDAPPSREQYHSSEDLRGGGDRRGGRDPRDRDYRDSRDRRGGGDHRDSRDRRDRDRDPRDWDSRDPRDHRDYRDRGGDSRGGGGGGEARDAPRDPRMQKLRSNDPRPISPSSGGAGGDNDPQKQQLLRQVMSLTPQQIDALPEAQRRNILQLRAQMNN
eukprot:Nk52_evm9s276 gene=Nk52_evmTU9s276